MNRKAFIIHSQMKQSKQFEILYKKHPRSVLTRVLLLFFCLLFSFRCCLFTNSIHFKFLLILFTPRFFLRPSSIYFYICHWSVIPLTSLSKNCELEDQRYPSHSASNLVVLNRCDEIVVDVDSNLILLSIYLHSSWTICFFISSSFPGSLLLFFEIDFKGRLPKSL